MTRKGSTVLLQVSIPKDLMLKLKILAKKEKRSRSNLVSLLLDQAITTLIKNNKGGKNENK